MDQLSRIPRVGGMLLLGLVLGLLWAALSSLVQGATAHAEDDEPAGDGLLGVVTQSVPALTGVAEETAAAVQSTSSAIADTVEVLPDLGHLPAVDAIEPVAAVDSVVEPVVDPVVTMVVEATIEPVATTVDAVVEPVIELLDHVGTAVIERLPILDAPVVTAALASTAQAAHTGALAADKHSDPRAALAVDPVATQVAVAVSAASADHRTAHPAGESPTALATAGASGSATAPPAHLAAPTHQGTGLSLGVAAPHDEQAPPGPTSPTDTTPD